jgi:hypothetical protein
LAEEAAREEAHLRLMRLYSLAGQRNEALRQYGRLEVALRREEILAGRFPQEHPEDHGSEVASDPALHNLPHARNSFVGRTRDILEIKRLLSMTDLLTLTGVGGSGKTRLALEVARDLVGFYPDGVWLVELPSKR